MYTNKSSFVQGGYNFESKSYQIGLMKAFYSEVLRLSLKTRKRVDVMVQCCENQAFNRIGGCPKFPVWLYADLHPEQTIGTVLQERNILTGAHV